MKSRGHLKNLFGAVLVISLLGGCATDGRQQADFGLGNMELNELKRHEYQVIDTVEGVGVTRTILGWTFPLLNRKAGWTGSVSGDPDPTRAGLAKGRAMYDALGKVPDADAVFTVSETVERRGVPILFRVDTATVKIKAIRIKSDEELGKGRQSGRSITITSEGDLFFDIED